MRRVKKHLVIKNFFVSIFAILFVIIPFWMLFVNSFKTPAEVNELKLNLPVKWNLIENYSTVIKEGKILRGFSNTLIVLIFSLFIVIFLASLASWIFARNKLKIIQIIYYIAISGILIPPAVITTIRVLKLLHIYGNLFGLVIFYSGAIMSFAIFFITGFIKTIPFELEEAAKIDGASLIGVFFKIILPLLKSVISTSVIILTLFIWNDFIYPFYFLTHPSQYTVTLGLYNFIVGGAYYNINWHLLFADIVVTSIPLIILYFVLQKRIISGITAGAIKG